MKTPNLKPLSKNLSAFEKAKLLCADTNYRTETNNEKYLLTRDEEKEIFCQAREKNEIEYLNRIFRIYNLGNVFMNDSQSSFLAFQVDYEKLLGLICQISLNHLHTISVLESIDEFLYWLESDKKTKLSSNTEEKMSQLKTRLGRKGKLKELNELLSLWTPGITEKAKSQPNVQLQNRFLVAITSLRRHIKINYQVDYLIELAGFNFLNKNFQNSQKHYLKVREEFLSFEGMLLIPHMYKELLPHYKSFDFMHFPSDFECPEFIPTLEDSHKAVELSESEKKEARVEVNDLIKDERYCHP